MSYSMQQGATRRSTFILAAGAALAVSALAIRQRTRKAEFDNPPHGQFIEIAGTRLHYIERGEGPPLVLLHGNMTMIQDFESSGLIDLLAKNHRVIAFDRPGYGYSERPRGKVWTPQAQAELLHRALLYLDVDRPIVVGHSWGTLVAVSLAQQFPEYVKSLVLMSGYYYPTMRPDVPFMAAPAIPLFGDLMRYTVTPWVTRMLWPAMTRWLFGPAPVPERFSAEFPVWLALRPSQLRASAAEAALMIPSVFSLRRHYHELRMPVLIVAGNDDRHVHIHAHSERLHQELPQSTLHVTREAGHMVHHSAQLQIIEAIALLETETAAGAVPHAEQRYVPMEQGSRAAQSVHSM